MSRFSDAPPKLGGVVYLVAWKGGDRRWYVDGFRTLRQAKEEVANAGGGFIYKTRVEKSWVPKRKGAA